MSLLFIDGFDHYVTADLLKKWSSSSGSPVAINSSAGRRSGSGLRLAYASGGALKLTKNVTASATLIVGFALNVSALPTSGSEMIMALLDGSTIQISLMLTSSGTLSVLRAGTTSLTDGTSVATITPGTSYYIELKATIADSISAGGCKVRINNAEVINVATGQDTKNTANASASAVQLGGLTYVATLDYDDFYVCNSSGSTNNDFLGDVRIDTLYPTSDGNYSQFTCSTGSSHFALVDETAPNTSDYNDGSAVNDRDSYGMGNLAALTSQTVYGLQVNAALMKDDAGAKSAATFVRSSSTNGDGASTALGTSQVYVSQVFETDPNGAIAWTETTVNAMEAGVKVTA